MGVHSSSKADKPGKGRPASQRLAVALGTAAFCVLYCCALYYHLTTQQQRRALAAAGIPAGGGGNATLAALRGRWGGSSAASSSSVSSGSSSSSSGSSSGASGGSGFSLPDVTLRYFPQAARCATRWMADYSALHAAIRGGAAPERYFVSVAVEAGIADRLSGMITQFWLAVLGRRAFTALAYGDVPSFAAVCDAPHANWTAPPELPPAAVEPLKFTYQGVRGFAGDRSYNASVDATRFAQLYLVNSRALQFLAAGNLSDLPAGAPATPYLISSSNRGRSWAVARNPYHRDDFWRMGVPPADAFMCGFFYLCAPNAAITSYYARYWDALAVPGALRIGIQVRMGDRVFTAGEAEGEAQRAEALASAAEWFECAEAVQKVYALPGQRVLWYLNSDSQLLRKAAKAKYGDKLITDDGLAMTHPDCFQGKGGGGAAAASASAAACQRAAMDEALQHSLGALLTFSMTDFHVISRPSGFGRLGAWLSGRWGNIFQVVRGQGSCNPHKPVPPEESAFHWAGV